MKTHVLCLTIFRSVLFRMRNVSDKSRRENPRTHFRFKNFFENRVFHEKMWKNVVELGRQARITIRYMRIACWIPKAVNTHSDYVRGTLHDQSE
jgi:hypothetical protein